VRLWTIQPATVWNELQSRRMLCADRSNAPWRGEAPPAYEWLREQLTARLPGYTGGMLWWAYCEKPDLRAHRHSFPVGEVHVRLELDAGVIGADASVSFPSWAWNRVYCQDYLPLDAADLVRWTSWLGEAHLDEDSWPPPEPWQSALESSWQRLFSRELPPVDPDRRNAFFRSARREAVFEKLQLDMVRHATTFRGAAAWRQPSPSGATARSAQRTSPRHAGH